MATKLTALLIALISSFALSLSRSAHAEDDCAKLLAELRAPDADRQKLKDNAAQIMKDNGL